MTEREEDNQLRLFSSGALFLLVLGLGGFACLFGHFFCLVLGWLCFKEQTCSMTSAITSHWALSVQLQLRGDLHHKNPINLAPPLQSHRNPVAPGRGTESSQVSWETQHTKVPLDSALCSYLCINRAGAAASSLFHR